MGARVSVDYTAQLIPTTGGLARLEIHVPYRVLELTVPGNVIASVRFGSRTAGDVALMVGRNRFGFAQAPKSIYLTATPGAPIALFSSDQIVPDHSPGDRDPDLSAPDMADVVLVSNDSANADLAADLGLNRALLAGHLVVSLADADQPVLTGLALLSPGLANIVWLFRELLAVGETVASHELFPGGPVPIGPGSLLRLNTSGPATSSVTFRGIVGVMPAGFSVLSRL